MIFKYEWPDRMLIAADRLEGLGAKYLPKTAAMTLLGENSSRDYGLGNLELHAPVRADAGDAWRKQTNDAIPNGAENRDRILEIARRVISVRVTKCDKLS